MKKLNALAFCLLFVILGSLFMWLGAENRKEHNRMKAEGVEVTAVISRVDRYAGGADDTDDYDVFFTYTYNGKEYTDSIYNYPGEKRVGHQVEGYVYPDSPGELFLPTSGIWTAVAVCIYIFAGLCLFVMILSKE